VGGTLQVMDPVNSREGENLILLIQSIFTNKFFVILVVVIFKVLALNM
jgi:LPS O-antigen subunit length determinant protein (WzzB/FepE family)